MTAGYIIQVHYSTIKYIGRSGRETDLPRFFKSPWVVRDYAKARSNNVRIIRIPHLEEGLEKTRNVEIMTYDEFVGRYCQTKKKVHNPDAVYLLRKPSEPMDDIEAGILRDPPTYYTFRGVPRIFASAGQLRAFMTLRTWRKYDRWYEHDVLEITYEDDGITPRKIIEHDATNFYCLSPSCKRRWNNSESGKKDPR